MPRTKNTSQEIIFENNTLVLGEKRVPLLSGAMHYWRHEKSIWRKALMHLKELGLTAVETYAPWSIHETAPGRFDFGERDASKDLLAFLELANDVGLYAFLRPGPHINAELTYFGIPEWIIHDPECQAQSPHGDPVLCAFPPKMFPCPSYASSKFQAESAKWYQKFAEIIRGAVYPFGPIVLLQVDNEAAFYFRDSAYDQDYHPDAKLAFQKYLRKKYKTLAAIQKTWSMRYGSFEEIEPPVRFEIDRVDELPIHLDWTRFQEQIIVEALSYFETVLADAGLDKVPTIHNVPLGELGLPINIPDIEKAVSVVGLDYYHTRKDHAHIKRRTLFHTGTSSQAFAPEIGCGGPPWFKNINEGDSLFTVLCALAYGLRGFNIYMAVDRDRWYGGLIDTAGDPKPSFIDWKALCNALHRLSFHTLKRSVDVAIMAPREYQRLSRATNLLGPISIGSVQSLFRDDLTLGCRTQSWQFRQPIQSHWWWQLTRFEKALTEAQISYCIIDGDASLAQLQRVKAIIAPTYEYVDKERWNRLAEFAHHGLLVFGPEVPSRSLSMRPRLLEIPKTSRHVTITSDGDAAVCVTQIAETLGLTAGFQASPAPVEICAHYNDEGVRVLFVINPSDTPLETTLSGPNFRGATDVISGEHFYGTDVLKIPMKRYFCRMLEVHPSPAIELSEESENTGTPRMRVATGANS